MSGECTLYDRLWSGAEAWNAWRARDPSIVPDASGLDLCGCALEGANLAGVIFRGTNLQGTALEGADLRRADLRGASLAGSCLDGANLEGAATEGTDFEGADLRGVRGLTQSQLDVAWLDDHSRLPAGLAKPSRRLQHAHRR